MDINGLRLVLVPETGELRAIARVGAASIAPDAEMLARHLEANGWTVQALDPPLVAAFFDACRQALATGGQEIDLPIGAVHHGYFELEVQPDNMSVLLVVHRPVGGKPVAVEDVLAGLAERGVAYGIDREAIAEAVAAMSGQPVAVATGTPPTPPQPTRFVSELDSLKPQATKEVETAKVDFRELGSLLLVSPGQVLMRRIPAVPGAPGTDVFGRPVQPPEIQDLPFADGLSGVAVDENDPCVLRAAIAGAPSVVERGVNVSPMVEVEAVDIVTGNVNFDGTLHVRGDIKTGMSVRVSGDVVVGGTIEAAQVEAGGDITVAGGVIGAAEGVGDGRQAQLSCGGTLKARFVNNASISTGRDVQVEREIRQSEVLAGGSILVGLPGMPQGLISGGQCRALRAIRAGTLGSAGGTPTFLQAGVNPHANAQKAALEQRRQRLAEDKRKLEQLIAFLKAHPEKAKADGLGERTLRTYAKVQADIAEVEEAEARLAAELVQTEEAVIEGVKRIYSGVNLQIGNRRMEIIDDMNLGGKAVLVDDKIVMR